MAWTLLVALDQTPSWESGMTTGSTGLVPSLEAWLQVFSTSLSLLRPPLRKSTPTWRWATKTRSTPRRETSSTNNTLICRSSNFIMKSTKYFMKYENFIIFLYYRFFTYSLHSAIFVSNVGGIKKLSQI